MNKRKFEKYIKSLPKNAKVLDAGCGDGNNSRYIQSIRPDLDICAIDIDGSKQHKVPEHVRFFTMSVEDLSRFPDEHFDCVACFHVIEHLADPSKAVAEFHRVLKPNGIIFAESPHWVSTITPIGFNFYDDPTHIRPHNTRSFGALFRGFSIKYLKFETPIFFYLGALYNLNQYSPGFLFRRLLKFLGVYKTAVFIIATKK